MKLAPTLNSDASSLLKTEEDDEEGSETEPEADSEHENKHEDDEGEATESESNISEASLSQQDDRGVKPRLVARDDQTATGKFTLKRPKQCYDGTPVKPGPIDSVPASINKFLRDYQREGVQFFYERYCEGRGGVLGDDMGLGSYGMMRFSLHKVSLRSNCVISQ